MVVSLYAGIPKDELNAARTTSEGKQYTINHPEQLLGNMRYKGGVYGRIVQRIFFSS